jgi:hypothetical protein
MSSNAPTGEEWDREAAWTKMFAGGVQVDGVLCLLFSAGLAKACLAAPVHGHKKFRAVPEACKLIASPDL